MDVLANPGGPGGVDNGGNRPRRWTAHSAHPAVAIPHRERDASPPSWRLEEWSVAASSPQRPVVLDGSRGEGGGQILRSALTLSLVTGRPFRIERIRANRDKPGLRPQHAAAVEAAARLCNADVRGAAVGSSELDFRPGPLVPRDLDHEIGTAGATTLVLQTIALPLAMRADSPVRVALTGGTINPKAPSLPFLERTWTRYLAAAGLKVAIRMPQAGFYPRGGGRLEAWIEPGQPQPLTLLDRGPLKRLTVLAATSRLPDHVADRMSTRARDALAEAGVKLGPDDAARTEWPAASPGAACAVSAAYEHVTTTTVGIGERGKPAERVAEDAVAEFLAYQTLPGAVDPHSADQILLVLALADGRSTYTVTEVTEHLRTHAVTIRAFLDRPIRIDEPTEDKPGRVIVG